MREIKFRKWGRYTDDVMRMVDWIILNANNSVDFRTDENEAFMQYTGLHDKNGKEIYEGDILGGYPHATVWVEYANDWGCFEACWDEDYSLDVGYKAIKKESQLLANALLDCKDKWEVIGNIYENPELLKNGQ